MKGEKEMENNSIVASKDTINLDMFTGASEDIYGDLNIDEEDELEVQYELLKQHKDRFRSVALDRLERELTSFYDLPHSGEARSRQRQSSWTIWQ